MSFLTVAREASSAPVIHCAIASVRRVDVCVALALRERSASQTAGDCAMDDGGGRSLSGDSEKTHSP
ncbi:MAG: hypothetical protein AAFV27_07690, partial [Pseudomonadota bacterium]